jgi:NADH-quinone oxidoreductase subunit L
MFLALGVGAWSAAIFHFANHAFFKALLFLAAGVVIQCAHHEQNMHKLGGLKDHLRLVFWVFLIGAAALASFPLITNGFYSKDAIIWYAWSSPLGSPWLWAAASIGAIVTAIYSFRIVFLTFLGSAKTPVTRKPGAIMQAPLIVLAIFSVFSGFVQLPHWLGDVQWFSNFVDTALPAMRVEGMEAAAELLSTTLCALGTLLGIYLTYVVFWKKTAYADSLVGSSTGRVLHKLLFAGWGFDWIYSTFVVRPFIWIAHLNRNDVVDSAFDAIAGLTEVLHHVLSGTQTGKLRRYAMGIAVGAVLTIAILVFL